MASTDFDARARTWDEDPAKHERAWRVADAIVAGVPDLSAWSVLDYGCGTGLLGFALLPHVDRVTFADTSGEMLAVVEEKIAAGAGASAATLLLDLAKDPPPPTRYDVVCTLMALHHVPDVEGMLRVFHEVLAPGGFLCISDLDSEDGSFHGPGADVHPGFDRDDLAARLGRAGFGPARFTTPCEVVKVTEAGTVHYPLFLAIARRA
jgi:2-polyprenyl-3-methyl-5-hydroxy-6-metoxy-1,4-benzoquinol methylase